MQASLRRIESLSAAQAMIKAKLAETTKSSCISLFEGEYLNSPSFGILANTLSCNN